MITRSKRKAYIFCEANSTNDDIVVSLRVEDSKGKRHTYLCTPFQVLNHLMNSRFIWLDTVAHI